MQFSEKRFYKYILYNYIKSPMNEATKQNEEGCG